MSGSLGDYRKLVREAQNKRIQITREQEKEIRSMYLEVARDLGTKLKQHKQNSLSYRWLQDYAKKLRQESKNLFKGISRVSTDSIHDVAKSITEAERRFYTKACPALSERFSDVFSTIPKEMVEELMSGGIYRDFAGLSEKIWDYQRKYDRDIQTIINRGIVQQKSAYDLAKDLETYLNPSAKKPWNWGVVYPGVNRVVDYNTQRLARTAVTHAYQLSFQRATKDNPFVEGYQWHSSNAGRACPLCRERNGQIYDKNSLPFDHPNGMCVVTAEIPKSLNEIGEELGDWATGRNNDPALDKWLNPIPDRDTINLTEDEEYALMDYISSGSYKLNYPLRKRIPLTDEQTQLMHDLDSALTKMPFYHGTVYRSLDDTEIEDIDAFIGRYKVGFPVKSPAYLSTGTSVYDESFPIQFVIQSNTGRDIRAFNPEESEILFARDTSFCVVKISGRTIFLKEGMG